MSTSIPEVQEQSEDLNNLRKILAGVVYVAPYSADPIETLFDADGNLKTLPEGYEALGLMTEAGISWEFSADVVDTRSAFHLSATRVDRGETTRTLAFELQEIDKRVVRELATGSDLSGITTSVDGEVTIDQSDPKGITYHRVLAIGYDGSLDSTVVRGRFHPRVAFTSLPGESWAGDALAYALEARIFHDSDEGYSVRDLLAGSGFNATELGYAV